MQALLITQRAIHPQGKASASMQLAYVFKNASCHSLRLDDKRLFLALGLLDSPSLALAVLHCKLRQPRTLVLGRFQGLLDGDAKKSTNTCIRDFHHRAPANKATKSNLCNMFHPLLSAVMYILSYGQFRDSISPTHSLRKRNV